MKISRVVAPLTAVFLAVAGTADAQVPASESRYEFLDGGFSALGRSDVGENKYFSAYVYDRETADYLLCAGVRVSTNEGIEAGAADVRTPSQTLSSLWRKAAEEEAQVAEYGSCVRAQPWEVKVKDVELIADGGATTDRAVIFRQDAAEPTNSWDYQNRLLTEKYPELLESLEGERWDEFVAEARQYIKERTHGLNKETTCEGAGFYWDEVMEIRRGTYTGQLPVCPRTYP